MKKLLFFVFSLSLFSVMSLSLNSDTLQLPFKIGEKLIFKVNYGILSGGTFTMEIIEDDTISGHKCYHIKSRTKTNKFFDIIYKVRDKIDSYWDMEKLVSRKYVKKLSEGHYKQFRIHYYFPEDTLTQYVKHRKGKITKTEFKSLPNAQDALSIFYYIRLQDFNVGDSIYVNVTADGRNYITKVIIEKKEKLNTIFGEKECFKVHPVIEGETIFKQTGEMYLWLTADEFKIPVKLESEVKYGKFSFKLKDAKNVRLKIKK